MKIKRNDIVMVQAGRDKGKKGKVLRVLPKNNRAIVEGINFVKRHQKQRGPEQQGGIIHKEATINLSNLMLICPQCNKITKVGFIILKDGSKARTCKKCNATL